MNLLSAVNVNSSGLTAQRQRVEIVSENLANAQTTRTKEGGPYRRKDVIFTTKSFAGEMNSALQGVEVSEIIQDKTAFERRFEPEHPDADAQGYVQYPNVNVMTEMANMMNASRSYEANLASIGVLKTMIQRTIELGR